MDTMKLAIMLFIFTYICLFIFTNYRHVVALISAAIFIALKILPVGSILESIDFNVLLMIFGIMGTVSLFIESKMPVKISNYIVSKVHDVKWLTLIMALFAGIVSAFIDNVATVLMIAPVALVICKKAKVSPVPMLISISIFSNLEGAATLVGDTTAIMLAGAAKMNFLDFFIHNGQMGLFFIVQISLILCLLVLGLKLKEKSSFSISDLFTKVDDYFPTYMLVGTIITLIIFSFVPQEFKPDVSNGLICCFFYLLGGLQNTIKTGEIDGFINSLKEIDYSTLLLLLSLFLIIGGVKEAGVIESFSKLFLKISNDPFIVYTAIVFVSCLFSAFIDNIPYVATMLPVIALLSKELGIDPNLLYYGLIIGSTLGGNITPIGASANITSLGILKKNGYTVPLKEYLSYSIPITLIAVFSGYLITYIIFML